MSQTVIGIFESSNQAQEAKAYLVANGFNTESVDISSGSAAVDSDTSDANEGEGFGDSISRFFHHLFDDEDEAGTHTEAARRGVTVTVHARTEDETLRAVQVLDNFGAVDVNEYARGASDTGYTRETTDTTGTTGTIPVIEEDLQVGKREVETGGVRLRSRIVERPVEESIRLREEHVNIERNPVNRPATEADFNGFEEGTVEVREHAERPVVAKEARVVEEVSLGKDVSEREETVSDTVRHTEVETENLHGDQRNLRDQNL